MKITPTTGPYRKSKSTLPADIYLKRCDELKDISTTKAYFLIEQYKKSGGAGKTEVREVVPRADPCCRVRILFSDINIQIYCNPPNLEDVQPSMPGNLFRGRHLSDKAMPCIYCFNKKNGKAYKSASDRVIDSRIDKITEIENMIAWILLHEK